MRRLLIGLVVAAATVLVPMWALAGNQEVAEQIAANLRKSGQLHGYKIGVKYQDGTAWLRGQVTSPEQMNAALSLVFQTPGVDRVVNNLTVAEESSAAPAAETAKAEPASALDKVQAALTERLNKIQSAGSQSLQQSTGAVAAEQLPRVAADTSDSQDGQVNTSVQRIEQSAKSPFKAPIAQTSTPYADRVPTTIPQGSVEPVAATTSQPTLAPPKHALTGLQTSKPIPVAMTQPPAPVAPAAPVETVVPGAVPGAVVQGAPVAGVPVQGTPIPGIPVEGMPVQGVPVDGMVYQGAPLPAYGAPVPATAMPPVSYDQPHLPNYSWPGYAAYPNYAALTYPKQYSPTAWPYIGPFYPYPQVPLGWRKVTLEWHDGWWFLDFDDCSSPGWFSGLFRHH